MITNINEFKKYFETKQINEGGGAGINFELKNGSKDIEFTITIGIKKDNGKIKVTNKSFDITNDLTLDMVGYDDGAINFKNDGLFDYVFNIDDNKVEEITKKLPGDDEEYGDAENTLYDILKENEEAELTFSLYGEIKIMKFSGWLRDDITEGYVIFDSSALDLETIDIEIEINDDTYYLNGQNFDVDVDDLIKNALFPEFKATGKFQKLYNLVFNFDFEEYVINVLKDDIDSLDDYFNNDNDYSKEDAENAIKNDDKELLSDIANDILDKYGEFVYDARDSILDDYR